MSFQIKTAAGLLLAVLLACNPEEKDVSSSEKAMPFTGDTVHYTRHEFHGEPEDRVAPLVVFAHDVPYLTACGVFPPFHLLNDQLRTGGSDGGMSPGATWKPFELTRAGYDSLAAAIQSVDLAEVRPRARYAHLRLLFDTSFDRHTDVFEWMKAVCAKHRDTYLARQMQGPAK